MPSPENGGPDDPHPPPLPGASLSDGRRSGGPLPGARPSGGAAAPGREARREPGREPGRRVGSPVTGRSPAGGGATRVVNLKGHREDPAYADVVYVGRAMHRGGRHLAGSPFACPFRPGPDGTREEVVAQYRAWLLDHPDLLARPPGLKGKRLGCWCVPLPCHAQVLAEPADAAR